MLSSWSRRRAAVAAEAVAEDLAAEEAIVAKQQEAWADKSDGEILEELGLPDPDDLVQGDDFKGFLSKAVPAHLRKRALRKLWLSNPVLACVDGLNDYDDDYLTGSFGQGPISTTYQVGKGILAHLVEMERQKEALLSANDEVPAFDDNENSEDLGMEDQTEYETAKMTIANEAEEDTQAIPAPRRMKFQFKDDAA